MENEPLVLDLIEWIAGRPRAYDEVMEAWRTSCPRLTIWEDAVDAGFVSVGSDGGFDKTVSVTGKGRAFLEKAGRTAG
ncbi:MAG: hypothetical protein AAGF72_02585 [Pseudomonadota bacterium]